MTASTPLTPANEPEDGTDPAALTDEELAEAGMAVHLYGKHHYACAEYAWLVDAPTVRAMHGVCPPCDCGLREAHDQQQRLIAALRASRAVADDLAIALHHCSAFLPLFLSEHGEEGRKLRRALAVYEQEQTAMKAYCDLTGTHRPDLTNRTVTPKDVHD